MKIYLAILFFLIVSCKENKDNTCQNVEYDLKKFMHVGMDEFSFNKFTQITNWEPATDVVPEGKIVDTLHIGKKKLSVHLYSRYYIYTRKKNNDTLWLALLFCRFNGNSTLKKYCFSSEKITLKNLFCKLKTCDSLQCN
jgi:hypothetical protein